MALIKSISGIRGTIGGKENEGLTPIDIVKYAAGFAQLLAEKNVSKTIVIGRDARISGQMVSDLVCATVSGMGFNIIDLGLSTTPTVEMEVVRQQAGGGIILTASHNPRQWNALKLLNEHGEFISAIEGQHLLEVVEKGAIEFASVDELGEISRVDDALKAHIDAILQLELVDVDAIKAHNFKIVVDGVNSSGGVAVPALLRALGVEQIDELHCEPTGHFAHNPEPLDENLMDIKSRVESQEADLGIVVDPDVDRLAFICEDGRMFGEEYTLVAIADYILQNKKGNTVSNLSSTAALKVITEKHGGSYTASAVGEVNVVKMMKEKNAVIGGEGNGGVIYPELHYGRDALVGIALFLTHLAKYKKPISMLRASYPEYHIAKQKVTLTPEINLDDVFVQIRKKYNSRDINEIDGLKIHFDQDDWVHLRKSNTEPIIRIYSESDSRNTARSIGDKLMVDIKDIIKETM